MKQSANCINETSRFARVYWAKKKSERHTTRFLAVLARANALELLLDVIEEQGQMVIPKRQPGTKCEELLICKGMCHDTACAHRGVGRPIRKIWERGERGCVLKCYIPSLALVPRKVNGKGRYSWDDFVYYHYIIALPERSLSHLRGSITIFELLLHQHKKRVWSVPT